MSINHAAELTSLLSAQKTSNTINVATLKLANQQIEAQGAAALALIQAIPQSDNSIGSNINVRA